MTAFTRTKSLLLVALIGQLLLSGCSTAPKRTVDTEPPTRTYEEVVNIDKPAIEINDPIEGFNRGVYRFNYYFDKFLFLPVVKTYEFIMPDYVEKRVSNFIDNIFEINNLTNNLLQLKFKQAGTTVARFAINTTVGIAGLWDPATSMNLHRQPEDFGQTLGHYGVGNGPYIVLPIIGPSNLRDATGLVVDTGSFNLAVNELESDWMVDNNISPIFNGVSAVDTRHRQPFRYYSTGSPFEYEMVRMLYTSQRKVAIEK